SLIQLLQSWHPAFGELELRPPAHHADPLPGRRSLRLLFQHPQTVSERGNAIPAKFQVVIEPAADQVRMRVVEARDHHSLAKVPQLGVFSAKSHHVAIGSHRSKLAISNGDRLSDRTAVVLGSNLTVEQNQIR